MFSERQSPERRGTAHLKFNLALNKQRQMVWTLAYLLEVEGSSRSP